MKSQNELTISGTIASDISSAAESRAFRFLAHNFGGGKETLFLPCVVFLKQGEPFSFPGKGTEVLIFAYLRPYKGRLKAVVKSITI